MDSLSILIRRWHSLRARLCKLSVQSIELGRGDVLREEELELLVGELAQLRTEHIVYSNVICIPAVRRVKCQSGMAMRRPVRVRATVASGEREMGDATHARYATARLASWLKCSDSIKRSSRFQLIWDGSLGAQNGWRAAACGEMLKRVACRNMGHATGFSGRKWPAPPWLHTELNKATHEPAPGAFSPRIIFPV